MKFGKLARGIWKNLPWKTVVPTQKRLLQINLTQNDADLLDNASSTKSQSIGCFTNRLLIWQSDSTVFKLNICS